MLETVMDQLEKKITAKTATVGEDEEILVPRKCAYCRSNVICTVLPTFIGLSKVGIVVGVEDCPYHIPNRADKREQ